MLAPYDWAAERAANAEERGSLDPIAEASAGHRCSRLGPRDRCVASSERGRSVEDPNSRVSPNPPGPEPGAKYLMVWSKCSLLLNISTAVEPGPLGAHHDRA